VILAELATEAMGQARGEGLYMGRLYDLSSAGYKSLTRGLNASIMAL
jgi:hypothetical protein